MNTLCTPNMRQTVLASAIALCLHNVAWAKLPDTGQVKCYGATSTEMACPAEGADFYGQDANHPKNPLSYTDNGDKTITDNVTGLMWAQSPDLNDDGEISADDMQSFEDAKAGATTFNLAGHTDWRLPTIKELYSLMNFSGATGSADPSSTTVPTDAVPYIDTAIFDFEYGDGDADLRYIDAQYWSITEYVGTTMAGVNSPDGDPTAFGVNFADGRIKGYGTTFNVVNDGRYVRYVRGDSYGVNSFTNNNDKTISDASTDLMWMQEDSGSESLKAEAGTKGNGSVDWQEALEWCESLEYANYSDWRLPNAKELQSIVDYTRSLTKTNSAAIDPLFEVTTITDEGEGTNYPFYWTSTTHRDGPDFAVYVAFGEALGCMTPQGSTTEVITDVHGAGAQRSDPKTANETIGCGNGPQGDVIRVYNYARCVRDLQVDDTEPMNNIPTATNVTIAGTLEVGQTLTGGYTYSDPDNDPESGSTFYWYRADDAQGTNKVAITGATATTYTLVAEDVNKSVQFCLMPSDGKTVGPESEEKDWAELTTEEQSAASQLGYNQAYWDDPETGTATLNAYTAEVRQPAAGEDLDTFWDGFKWADLTPTEQSLWGKLGWNEAYWTMYLAYGKLCSTWSTAVTVASTTPPPTDTGTTPPPTDTGTTPPPTDTGTTPPPTDTGTTPPPTDTGTTPPPTDTGTTPPPTDTGTTPPPTDTGTTPPPTDTGTTPPGTVIPPPPTTGVEVACALAGSNALNCVYKANGQSFANLTVTQDGNISGPMLSGKVTNAGWISNATIVAGATLTGGTLTGFIVNNGTLADITFRGASITGGILKGVIDNLRNGLLADVTLAANAHIIGGKLQGLIKGDCTAPALLDNLVIASDSDVSCVTLGENVVIEEGAKVKEGGDDTTTPPPVEVPNLPELGQAIATDKDGVQVKTETTFRAGIAVNEGEFQQTTTAKKITDIVNVQSFITINPSDIDRTADIVVYATYQATSKDEPVYLMLDANRGYHLWDRDATSLIAFQSGIKLGETQLVNVYRGVLLYDGILEVTVGYRKLNGTIVLSPKTIGMTVAD